MNKTAATEQRRREQKVARRRKRIEQGTRIHRFAGNGRPRNHEHLERRRVRQARDIAAGVPDVDPTSGKGRFSRWVQRATAGIRTRRRG